MKKGVKITLWILAGFFVIGIISSIINNDKPKDAVTENTIKSEQGTKAVVGNNTKSTKTWAVYDFVDEFGDKTGKKFVGNGKEIKGTFSNTAAKDEPLEVVFLITKESVGMEFYENYYGIKNDVPNTFILFEDAIVSVKDCNGETYKLRGTTPNSSGQRLYILPYANMISILKKGGKIQFSVKDGNVSTYRFDIDNADGFEEALNQL